MDIALVLKAGLVLTMASVLVACSTTLSGEAGSAGGDAFGLIAREGGSDLVPDEPATPSTTPPASTPSRLTRRTHLCSARLRGGACTAHGGVGIFDPDESADGKDGPPAEPAPADITLQKRIEAFIDSLKNAAYTFNPPSPIDVDQPTRVYLLLDPQGNISSLIEKLKALAPDDATAIQSGQTKWAPVMEASLSAAESDFLIKPCALEKKSISGTEQTQWCWEITPQHPGAKMLLNLSLRAILPGEFAPAHEVTLLHREIDVRVTTWWLFDHYFDRYWKWLLGGLGGFAVGVIAREWKRRKLTNTDMPKQTRAKPPPR